MYSCLLVLGTPLCMKVNDPTGHEWRVSRRWIPWRRRRVSSAVEPEPQGAPFVVILLAVAVLYLIPVVLLAVAVAAPLLVLLLAVPVALLLRVPFDNDWIVELRRGPDPWTEVTAGDWEGTKRRMEELADAVSNGDIPPRTLGADPPA